MLTYQVRLMLCIGQSAWSQSDRLMSAGALGGVPLLDAFHSVASGQAPDCSAVCDFSYEHPATIRYTVGALVELRLTERLAVEGDALYGRFEL